MATHSFSLTVAEGKKLIAKGVLAHPPVATAMENGTVIIGSGSTNSYIAREVLKDRPFVPTDFLTGRTLPTGRKPEMPLRFTEQPVRIRKGEIDRIEDMDAALAALSAGDVLFKGANAIGADGRTAGILIGHPTSGGIGASIGICVARRVLLIHPVGLEKTVPADLVDLAAIAGLPDDATGPTLFVSPGEVFTECDAIEALFPGLDAFPYAAGGIFGAEGATWILIHGEREQIKALNAFLDTTIRGEPPFPA